MLLRLLIEASLFSNNSALHDLMENVLSRKQRLVVFKSFFALLCLYLLCSAYVYV